MLACKVAPAYVMLTTPIGRFDEVVVTLTGALLLMVMLRFAVVVAAVGVSESVSVTVKLDVPRAVGVPVIAPVELLSVRPGGKLPVVTAQLYGVTPPVAVRVAL